MKPSIETHVALAHGNGGRLMRNMIDQLFVPAFKNPFLDTSVDAVRLPQPDGLDLVVTTDGFTVDPLEFCGGNIGSLAVHGTVNDLAVSGAAPKYLTLSVFLEEGLDFAVLRRVIEACGLAARNCGVMIVAGDTKVLARGDCDGIYLSSTGIGFRPRSTLLGMQHIRPGDKVIVSGPVGNHGAAVLLARQEFGFASGLASDADSVLPQAQALLGVAGLRFMRDPTRGGLATVANEIARASSMTVHLSEAQIPIDESVQSVCELLGFDPLYLASEGRIVAVVAEETAALAVQALRRTCPRAAIVGEIRPGQPRVLLATGFGGQRMLDELEDDPLPRIC
jgi:hydrogenase expression/formation protein HypE